jgi:hypothetical protein
VCPTIPFPVLGLPFAVCTFSHRQVRSCGRASFEIKECQQGRIDSGDSLLCFGLLHKSSTDHPIHDPLLFHLIFPIVLSFHLPSSTVIYSILVFLSQNNKHSDKRHRSIIGLFLCSSTHSPLCYPVTRLVPLFLRLHYQLYKVQC